MGLNLHAALGAALVLGAPSVASAHALLTNPVPRDKTDQKLKMGPCGGDKAAGPLLKGTPVVQYDEGATIKVSFEETIGHVGCYQFRLSSSGDDKGFKLLKQVDDPDDAPASHSTMLTLPAGTTCKNCTLQMLQLMNGEPCTKNQDPATAAQGVYYSCADVRIGDFPDAGPVAEGGPDPEDDGGTSSSSSGGPSTTPTEGGGDTTEDGDNAGPSRNLRAGAGDDGCSVGSGASGGASFVLGAIAVALVRRRRRRQA